MNETNAGANLAEVCGGVQRFRTASERLPRHIWELFSSGSNDPGDLTVHRVSPDGPQVVTDGHVLTLLTGLAATAQHLDFLRSVSDRGRDVAESIARTGEGGLMYARPTAPGLPGFSLVYLLNCSGPADPWIETVLDPGCIGIQTETCLRVM